MTYWRTSRAILGGQSEQSPGSPSLHDTQQDSNSVVGASASLGVCRPNSCADDFNLGAGLLFLVVFLGSVAVVGGVAFAYLTFVPKPAEYSRGVESYRFKGH